MSDKTYLITGATGAQGGATAKALLAQGLKVLALVRNPDADNAKALAAAGASLVKGDWDDKASLMAALQGVYGVFSVQRPDADGTDSERRHGFALIEAARECGVTHFVHTSVCESGNHTRFPRWESGYWGRSYWTDKWDIEERVQTAGFPLWTVLKPAFMIDNFAMPKARMMFPHLRQSKIITAFLPHTRLQMTCADDVGAFALAAFTQPEKFHQQSIPMATEALTMTEVADVLNNVLGTQVKAEHVSPEEAKAAGLFPGWVRTQEWVNEAGYQADIDKLKGWGIPLTTMAEWVQRHRNEFRIGDKN